METQTETLAEFVRRARESAGFSLVDVERHSGGQITNGYVSRIENGYVANPTPKKLQALARGLGVPVDSLLAVACGAKPPKVANILWARVTRLLEMINNAEARDREHALQVLDMLQDDLKRRSRKAHGTGADRVSVAASPGGHGKKFTEKQKRGIQKDIRDNVRAVELYEQEENGRHS